MILAGGTWTWVESLRSVVAAAGHVIAADGGYSKAVEHGIHVDEVVGDLDSLRERDRSRLAEDPAAAHVHERDKDWTDVELGVDLALAREPAEIVMFGASGTRLDHTLTGLHLLEKGLARGVPIKLVAGRETVRLTDDELVLDVAVGDRVSLVPLSEACVVSTKGLRFGLADERLARAASRGVSNEAVDREVRVAVREGLLLVFHAPREGDADD